RLFPCARLLFLTYYLLLPICFQALSIHCLRYVVVVPTSATLLLFARCNALSYSVRQLDYGTHEPLFRLLLSRDRVVLPFLHILFSPVPPLAFALLISCLIRRVVFATFVLNGLNGQSRSCLPASLHFRFCFGPLNLSNHGQPTYDPNLNL